MNHIIDIRVLAEDFRKASLVGDVDLVEVRSFSRDELDPVDAFLRRIVQVVDDDDLVVSFQQREDGEGTDVSCSTILGNYSRRM